MKNSLNTVRKLASQRGTTLLELLIVLVVIAVLAVLVGPSFSGSIARAEVDGMRDKLASALQFARSEALKRKAPVSVCSSSDQAGCANNVNWEGGWIVFSDTNGDGAVSGGDQILQVEYDGNQLNTYSSGGFVITFNRIGRAAAGAGDYSFCHPDQDTRGRVVGVSVTGAVERRQETIGGC